MSGFEEERRPPIPAELKRRILVEAGHRCAIPVCRYIEVDIHHIVPWATCRAHEYDNLIALCPNCHRRADREEIDRKSLRIYKLNLRTAHDKFSQLEMDILFEAAKCPPGAALQWPQFNMLMLKRIVDAGYLVIHPPRGTVEIYGMPSSPLGLSLSEKGRKFLSDISEVEI